MRAVKPLTLAVANACLVMNASTFAQESQREGEDQAMSSVVVTATRGEKAIDKIPGAVSVITQRELESQYLIADDPSAALSVYVPGYAPSRQKLTSFGESLRGRAPLILLDGIPQSNPLRAGAREGYFADSAIIERIEVINGASAIQGLGATGGIINYITKTPKEQGTGHAVNARLSSQFRNDSLDWKTGYTLTHKSNALDMLGYIGVQQRGMGYDGNGRRLGIDTAQGDTLDSQGQDVFVKLGKTFGVQRLQASFNRFKLGGDGDYQPVNADLAGGIPTSSVPGTPPGAPNRNKVESGNIEYRHGNLGGGMFTTQLFKQDFKALYGAARSPAFQDASIAPVGTLFDQSEIVADKLGAKFTYVRPDTLAKGLETTIGLDVLEDTTEQRLAGTNRTWVPPLEFRSTAPFLQLEYEVGPVTLRGGLRREFARLNVDTYTTLASYGSREVKGGKLAFAETVKNLGAIWRFAPGWSMFVSSAEGFGLPDVGLVLRGIDSPGQSVSNLLDLQPVLTQNNEIGVNWRGEWGNVGVSYYDSRSDLGTTITVTNGVGSLNRVPTDVKGWELIGELKLRPVWSVFGSYATVRGKTAVAQGTPMDLDLGARNQGPNKLILGTNWQWSPKANLRVQAAKFYDRHVNQGRGSKYEERFNGYTLVDAATTWDTRHGRFGVGIENFFDRQYVTYYSQTIATDPAINTFAGRGRTLSVSWNKQF